MARGKGRGGRGAQETQQTHQSRHPTTSSTVVAPQMPLSSKPTSNNPAYENSIKPSTSTGLSDPLGQYRMEFDSFCGKSTSEVEGSHDPLGQYTMEFDDFCAKYTSEVEGHQQIDSQPPSHEDVDGTSQPVSHEHLDQTVEEPGEAGSVDANGRLLPIREGQNTQQTLALPEKEVFQKSEAIDVPWSGQFLSNDLTEFASGLQKNLDEDLFEAPSTYDLEYEDVYGHIVKNEISGLVGAIFEKYGDITRESDVSNPETISFFLERVCGVYQRLERTTFSDLTSADIDDMLDELRDLAKQKLNVGWLLEKVEQISETKSSFDQNYSTIEREAAEYVKSNERIDKEIEQYRMQIAEIQKKISLGEEEKVANESKAKEYKRMAVDCYSKVKAMANESLVHGLL